MSGCPQLYARSGQVCVGATVLRGLVPPVVTGTIQPRKANPITRGRTDAIRHSTRTISTYYARACARVSDVSDFTTGVRGPIQSMSSTWGYSIMPYEECWKVAAGSL